MLFTREITFPGAPENCLENYFNTHQDSLASFIPNELVDILLDYCMDGVGYIGWDSYHISVTVAND